MDILIKNINMPSEGRIINLTICSDGSVINNLPDAGGKMSSYRSGGVKAIPIRKELCEVFAEKCNDYADDAFTKESAIEAFIDTFIEVKSWTS